MKLSFKKINRSKINLIVVITYGISITAFVFACIMIFFYTILFIGASMWRDNSDTFTFEGLKITQADLTIKKIVDGEVYFTLDGEIEVDEIDVYRRSDETYEVFKIDGKNIELNTETTIPAASKHYVYIEGYTDIYIDSYKNYTCIDLTYNKDYNFIFSDNIKSIYNIETNSNSYRLVDKSSTGEYVSDFDRMPMIVACNVFIKIAYIYVPIVTVGEIVLGIGTIVEIVKDKKKKEDQCKTI